MPDTGETYGQAVDRLTGGVRLRRHRRSEWSRRLVRETQVTPADLIWPVFVVDGDNERQPIGAMPGVERLSVDQAVEAAREARSLGIPALALFPCIALEHKDERGSHILSPDSVYNRAIAEMKAAVPEVGIIADVALDPFTSHGQDGILRDGVILNDETVEQLAEAALVQAGAGADIIAPSDMMDGRIGVIREALDGAGHQGVAIMSYATKYASCFYGPYREAVGTAGLLKGDKRTYYIDPANTDEALREAAQDVEQGADSLLVKPGLPYLDIIWRLKEAFRMPTFAYQVSG